MVPREWISPIAVQHTVETHIHHSSPDADLTDTPNVQFLNGNSNVNKQNQEKQHERNRII